ncbi:hypothetical protein M3231_01135 [Neobacillus mesonae]|nr:hypothetical protein [Neobacillus mesonae]
MKLRVRIWPFIRYGVPAVIILLLIILTSMEDIGQFIKFLLFDVIMLNGFGITILLAGIFTFSFGAYMIISKKAANPKKMIIPVVLLTTVFLGLGYGLSYNAIDDFADVGNYLIGNVKEEDLMLKEFLTKTSSDGLLYSYTFEDGREFVEGYKGLSNVEEGEIYRIRYLPRTMKILSITSPQ